MLTSRITEGENRHFKSNTDHHNGDLNILSKKSFTHFKWLTLNELI